MSIPENFKTTIVDFLNDLKTTFPEHNELWESINKQNEEGEQELFDYCVKFYPERFFDILYQNNDIFNDDSEIDVHFLPNVDFKLLFNCQDISDKTKLTMWKYLQLLLFATVGSLKDKNLFGDTANLFEGMNEDELGDKLKDTMKDIEGFFSNMGVDLDNMKMPESTEEEGVEDDESESKDPSFEDFAKNMPNMEGLHEHLKGLFDGKIGKLAKELAEEISGDFSSILGEEANESTTTQDVLKKMMKNPKKMMDLIKNISNKIKDKVEHGEISKDELMGEASELMSKMKEMGGNKQFNNILKKFAGGMGKNMRMDGNALNRMAKQESTRDRLLRKMEKNKNLQESSSNSFVYQVDGEEKQERSSAPVKTDEELIAEFENIGKEEPKKTTVKKKKKKTKK